jgi:hypothetical protein
MMNVNRASHLTPIDLDLRWLAALSDEQRSAQDRHLHACAACAAAKSAHERALESVPSPLLEERLGRLRGGRAPRRLSKLWPLFLAPCLGAATLAWWGTRGQPESADLPVVGLKGAPNLRVYGRRGERVFAVTDGDSLAPGDAVRLVFDPPGYPFVIVGSIDAAGKASIYFPFGGRESAAVDPRVPLELPGSLVLDATQGPERVFALFSGRPLAAADLTAALRAISLRGWPAIRQTTRLPLTVDAAQTSFLFEKGRVP